MWKRGLRRCIICDRERKAGYRRKAGVLSKHKYVCPKGHPLVEGNLRKGRHECLTCHRERERERGRKNGAQPIELIRARIAEKQYCAQGHLLVEGNLRQGKRHVESGIKECLTCHREREKIRYHENREKQIRAAVEWQRKNRERYNKRRRVWDLAHRTEERPTQETQEYVELIRGDVCVYCNGPVEHIDHVIPVAAGGSSQWENLAPTCAHCNQSKNDRSLLMYLSYRQQFSKLKP